jgi:protein-L-isoaspartate(D-aspartate) O-methyltransferase
MTATPAAIDDTIGWGRRAGELAAKLTADGAITDTAWCEAFAAVPRHVFVPRFWALDAYNSPDRLVDGADPAQHDEWLDTVYSDQFLAVQWAIQDGYRMISSSASLPTLVARMLGLLDVHDVHRVLEIGTGTGYNTALLCHRVGAERVASIDIDAVLVAEALERLAQLGQRPQLVTGDGADGLPDGAPYDRVLSTCASPGVPVAWIEQLAGCGKIVAPFTVGGALAVLTKTGPDEVTGHLDSHQAWFMPLRAAAGTPAPPGLLVAQPEPAPANDQHHGTAEMDPEAFADLNFRLWLTLHLPRTVRVVDQVNEQFTRTGLLVHDAEHRAEAQFTDSGLILTTQDSRRLFDHVETAWRAWLLHGRPERQRIGITARTDGTQTAWLDTPTSGIAWPLPS